MKLIVGLGNLGREYAQSRHNFGWDAVALFAKKGETTFQEKSRFQAEIAEGTVGTEKILLVHPLTYMNRSGEAVAAIMAFYKIDLKDVLIVHDEMDFPLGKFAFVAEAGAAGHNGIKSIQERLSTDIVSRLRLGIGRPVGEMVKEDFVLQKFSDEEQKIVDEVLPRAAAAMEGWIGEGIVGAMNEWNG